MEADDLPEDYQFYVWRKSMGGIGYESFLNTPIEVIVHDLEFMSIENMVQKMKQDQDQEEAKKNSNA